MAAMWHAPRAMRERHLPPLCVPLRALERDYDCFALRAMSLRDDVSPFGRVHRSWRFRGGAERPACAIGVARCVPPAYANSRALPACDGEDAAATPTPTAGTPSPHLPTSMYLHSPFPDATAIWRNDFSRFASSKFLGRRHFR